MKIIKKKCPLSHSECFRCGFCVDEEIMATKKKKKAAKKDKKK
jgi:hypothetical protein